MLPRPPFLRRLPRAVLAGAARIACALAAFGIAASLHGLQPANALAQYGYDVWDSDSGLPQNSVETILQTSDGFLWLGTEEGLVRFDGVHFEIFDTRNTPALGEDFVQTLAETKNGDLWIGTANGLARYRRGRFSRETFGSTLEGHSVLALHESADGALWIGTREGLFRLHGSILTRFRGAAGTPQPVRAITELPGGELWFGVGNGVLRYRDEAFVSFGPETGLEGAVMSVAGNGAGGLWVGTEAGLFRFDAGRALSFPLGNPADRTVRAIYPDRAGTLWVATLGGLFALRDGRLMRFSTANGLASNEVIALLEDREGSLWVGTNDGGLNRLKDQRIANYTTRDGLLDAKIWTVFEDASGFLWVGTSNGDLARMEPGGSRFTSFQGFGAKVIAMAQDTSGVIWVGTRGDGLYRMEKGSFRRFELEGLPGPGTVINSIASSRDGSVWVGIFGSGLARIDKKGVTTRYDHRQGLPSDAVFSVYEDRAGDMWIATIGGGAARFHQGRFETFGIRDGLPNTHVLSISQDGEGIYWLGTRGGLARYDGKKFTTYEKSEGVVHDSVQRAQDDGHGFLWLTTNRGVFRVSLAELNAFAANPLRRVHPVGFATGNGMRNAECNNAQHGVARTRDGRLWFATVKGLAMADPTHIEINRVPPQVVVSQVMAGGRKVEPSPNLTLPPDRRDVQIDYTALSFWQPGAIRFQYRLQGFDSAWIDAGARRIAYYTNLPPGHYDFQVSASNEDGLWSTPRSYFSFAVAPHLYGTLWFRLITGAAIVLGVAVAHRTRVFRLRRREGMRAELVEAKLHALRAQLRPHFLFNTFNAVLPYIESDPSRARRMILQLAELLRTSLKSEPGQLISVEEELSILEQYASIERTRFGDRIRIEAHVHPSVRTARVPSFLLQPLVENAIKHGMKGSTGPVAVTVTVAPEGGALSLIVRDNGRGLTEDGVPAAAPGIGISNVRRRLEALYPRRHVFEVRNIPGGGCEASVRIPLDNPRRRREAGDPGVRRESA